MSGNQQAQIQQAQEAIQFAPLYLHIPTCLFPFMRKRQAGITLKDACCNLLLFPGLPRVRADGTPEVQLPTL